MLELPSNEINYYQLLERNKLSKGEISKFQEIIKNNNINDFDNIINTIYEYNLSYNESISLNNKDLQKIGIKKLFFNKKIYDRKIDELLTEHNEILKEKQLPITSNEDNLLILQRVNRIKELSNYYSQIKLTKNTITDDLKYKDDDLIAIVNNGIKQVKGFTLKDSQIYSLLVLLNKKHNKGKIAQILTGEGKTIIINSLAIIMVLKGHKVDIVTSNPILAKRDSHDSEKLFNLFGITVGNNIEEEENVKQIFKMIFGCEQENCYLKDVVYGTTFEFQGDILRDEYELTGKREKRGFDIVIVDEIDSMLIDEYASKTRLSKNKPFLEKYSVFLYLLWIFYKKLDLDDDEVVEDKELSEKLSEFLIIQIKSVINNQNENSKYFFPMSYMNKKFALDQVENWVKNLIVSLRMKENVEYIIRDNDIVPVDQDNTGVIQKAVTHSYGLHQFLQLKHNLPVTPISITTNYLSNLGFFKRYIKSNGNFIYGMTGTIGSKKARELLGNVYDLEFDYIPPSSSRILKELTSNISLNDRNWKNNIIRIVKRETEGNRGILIICENINSVQEIYEELNINCHNLRLITIIGEDNEEKKIPKEMSPKTVIISTNISGRGTDIKLDDEVLRNGGLHVIISFVPNNSRVEEQNYGRAGRKGEPGTWQLVINYQEEINKYFVGFNLADKYEPYLKLIRLQNIYNDIEINNVINLFKIENLRNLREKREITILENAIKFIDKVDKEDKLFNLYCNMIDSRKELRNDENKIYLDSIEERWAIFLYNLNIMNKSWYQIQSEFNSFKNHILKELDNGSVIKNPGYYNYYVNDKLALSCDYEREISKLKEVGNFFIDIIKQIGKSIFFYEKPPEYHKYIEK